MNRVQWELATHLERKHINVRNQIPARFAIFRIVSVEPEHRVIANRIAQQPRMIVLEPHHSRGVHDEPQLANESAADHKVLVLEILDRIDCAELHEDERTHEAHRYLLDDGSRGRWFDNDSADVAVLWKVALETTKKINLLAIIQF